MAVVTVRRANVDDASTVAHLLHAFNTEYASPVPEVDVMVARFTRLLDDVDVLVHLTEQAGPRGVEGVGFAFTTVRPSAYCDAGVAMLEELYVQPELRGRGAGTLLLDEVQHCLDERGVDELQVNVDSVDVAARRFYARHGFTNVEAAGPGEEAAQSRMLLYVRER